MALKTVYLNPNPDSLEWENVSNPDAALIDDGDASFATMLGSAGSRTYLAVQFFSADIPAGARIESVGLQIRMRGWDTGLLATSTAGTFYLVPSSLEEWRVAGIEARQDPGSFNFWEPDHLITPYARIDLDGEGQVDISYIRLAVTYDDGEPEPEPEPAEITIEDTEHIYDGEPHGVTVTTDPPGLDVSVTYDGSPEPPSEVGTYAVLAVVTDPAYTGAAAAVLTIARAIPSGGIVDPVLEITAGAHMTEGDTLPAMRGRILSGGEAQDLTGRTVRITIAPGPGCPPLLSREAIVDGKEWILPWQPGDTAGRGETVHYVQATVDGKQCAPARGYGLLQIQRRLG